MSSTQGATVAKLSDTTRRAGSDSFARRHLGISEQDASEMAAEIGFESLDELVDQAVPKAIRISTIDELPDSVSESEMLAELRQIASKNSIKKSLIGLGYSNTITPPPILRNILENPGWYTQYTPYQAEISQGRMEALFNFQTMVADLTGLEIANASLLDEGTAAAEAVSMAYGLRGRGSKNAVLISSRCHPQTIEVVEMRAEPLGIDVKVVDTNQPIDFSAAFAIVIQYPDTLGIASDLTALVKDAHRNRAMAIACCDLLSLTLLKPPGEMGCDIAVGSAQRFGVPLGFGGPHAAFFATTEANKRKAPGRIIGLSKDAEGNPAWRLALQTREQHIRRDKATSNICTAQVLLANIAAAYAIYHGPEGLTEIAMRIRRLALTAKQILGDFGFRVTEGERFDTLAINAPEDSVAAIIDKAQDAGYNLRRISENLIGLTIDETVTPRDLATVLNAFNPEDGITEVSVCEVASTANASISPKLQRQSTFLTQAVFNQYHSETEFVRYLKKLENKDLSLTNSMIPLGSCTMKLNATAEMLPISWPEFSDIHPFAPSSQTVGYLELIEQLEIWLARITGFAAVSIQPNAGSQGEYAGLLAIRGYHRSNGQENRNLCLIPSSAHGTNPASAVMAGMKVVPVNCDTQGNIDLDDLEKKAELHREHLAALMITYPSTHGVFESSVQEICQIVHNNGGQVYMDGANMNAQCGLTSPGFIGADVCHLNLHKTFCIPHGGGGPGVGPIGVASHLAPFLPGHRLSPDLKDRATVGAVSAAPYGSAGILPISWAYIRMMGESGITQATKIAILNANYMAKRLEPHFPIVYRGENGLVAHEFIVDFREWKDRAGVDVEDIAKRLMDYGFHAPTMSWPVAGTMMIEPTESESRRELDRFCDALISIKMELERIEQEVWPRDDNPLKNAPHTSQRIASDSWSSPYSRELAAFPSESTRDGKYWPPVARVDNVFGDRNLVCACPPLEAYHDEPNSRISLGKQTIQNGAHSLRLLL
jgi:glycine dehydrogenase